MDMLPMLGASGASWGPALIVLMYVVGVGLMLFELTIPGGIVGAIGGLLTIAAIYLAFTEQGLALGWALTGITVIVVPLMVIWTLNKTTLRDQQTVAAGYTVADPSLGELLGQRGEALTALRPAGRALLGGKKVDVVTNAEFIDKGSPVKVIQVEGSRVVVQIDQV